MSDNPIFEDLSFDSIIDVNFNNASYFGNCIPVRMAPVEGEVWYHTVLYCYVCGKYDEHATMLSDRGLYNFCCPCGVHHLMILYTR